MALKQVFVTPLTGVYASTQPDQDNLGDIRMENGNFYKYVKFTGTTTVAAGDVVCYTTAGDGLTVDAANTDSAAGVAMAAVASGTVQYGWIQIKGLATMSTALGSGAAGQGLMSHGASNKTLLIQTAGYPIVATVCVAATPTIWCDFPF